MFADKLEIAIAGIRWEYNSRRSNSVDRDISYINDLVDLVSKVSLDQIGGLTDVERGELYTFAVNGMVEAAMRCMIGYNGEDGRISNRQLTVFYSPYPTLIEENRYPNTDFIPYIIGGFDRYIAELEKRNNVEFVVSKSKFVDTLTEFEALAKRVYGLNGHQNGHFISLGEKIGLLKQRVDSSF